MELLMIRRRDSMSYTEFMRGKYEPENTSYVRRLLDNMTTKEIHGLKNLPFETLWAQLWLFSDPHDHELDRAKQKFEAVTSLIRQTKNGYPEPEWGFPKGRRFRGETDIGCAEREFAEETNIPRSAYMFVKDVVFTETFLGTNGVPYEHKYFLAILTKPSECSIQQKFTVNQRREISAIQWKTLSECRAVTRPHYTGRTEMLQNLAKFTSTIEVWIPKQEEESKNKDGISSASVSA